MVQAFWVQSGKKSAARRKGCHSACAGKLGCGDQAERPADQGQIFAPHLGQPHSGGDELAPDAKYDVIFMVLRYTQLDSVLDTLRANRTKNIVFVGNNVQTKSIGGGAAGKDTFCLPLRFLRGIGRFTGWFPST